MRLETETRTETSGTDSTRPWTWNFDRFFRFLWLHSRHMLGVGEVVSLKNLDTSTTLALERTYYSTQRTLMSWIRTSISMISFGFTIGKLADAVQSIQSLHGREISVTSIALFLVLLGTIALLLAVIQFAVQVETLHERGLPIHFSLEFIVALLLSIGGAFAFTALVIGI